MEKKNICVDIDGTLTFSGHFMPYLNEHFGMDVTFEEIRDYDFKDIFGVSEDDLIHFFKANGRKIFLDVELLESAKETMLELNEKHNVWIITARNLDTHKDTKKWLDLNGLGDIELITLGTPHKLEKALELKCDIFLEDHPEASLDIAKSGIKLFLMDAPYNKETDHENIIRVDSWKEIRTYLKKDGIL